MSSLEYQRQRSQLTLREGLAEYFSVYDKFLSTRISSPEAKEFFRCHDVVHVVFGCGLSLDQEMAVKVSSVFGTTGGFRVLKGYALPESYEIYEEISIPDGIKIAAKTLFIVPKILWRCIRMAKRWPWAEFDQFFDHKLTDIRDQFRITTGH